MVTFESSRENHTFTFSFPSRRSPGASASSSSSPSSATVSPDVAFLQKQREMRSLVTERLGELPAAPAADQSLQILQLGSASHAVSSFAEFGVKPLCHPHLDDLRDAEVEKESRRQKNGKSLRLKVGNASLKRLLSGAFAGAVSRTAVAPLETIRTHLMVGSGGRNVGDVFQHIVHTEGFLGLFRGNGVNVIRVAPSKAIELFAFDTIKKALSKYPGELSRIPVSVSSIAGAAAGVCSTLCTYPLELLKTRLTIQRGAYKNLLDACVKICQEEGPGELYRGLTPSLIGVVPYAAINYFAYDYLKKLYKNMTKHEQVGNLPTLFIGSAAGAIASSATFPLEVARKQMQVGALTGRPAYRNLLHALTCVLEQHGLAGLYRGIGASCIKLMPAAGISFMCYEACKRVLIEEDS